MLALLKELIEFLIWRGAIDIWPLRGQERTAQISRVDRDENDSTEKRDDNSNMSKMWRKESCG